MITLSSQIPAKLPLAIDTPRVSRWQRAQNLSGAGPRSCTTGDATRDKDKIPRTGLGRSYLQRCLLNNSHRVAASCVQHRAA